MRRSFMKQKVLTYLVLVDDVWFTVWRRRSWRRTSCVQNSYLHSTTTTTECGPSSLCWRPPATSSSSTLNRTSLSSYSKLSWMSTCPSFSLRFDHSPAHRFSFWSGTARGRLHILSLSFFFPVFFIPSSYNLLYAASSTSNANRGGLGRDPPVQCFRRFSSMLLNAFALFASNVCWFIGRAYHSTCSLC